MVIIGIYTVQYSLSTISTFFISGWEQIIDVLFMILTTHFPIILCMIVLKVKINKFIKIAFYISLSLISIRLAVEYQWDMTSATVGFIWFFTIVDHFIRQERSKFIVVSKDYVNKLGFVALLERNFIKVFFLCLIPITIVFWIIKKEVPWDSICKTKVVMIKPILKPINKSTIKW